MCKYEKKKYSLNWGSPKHRVLVYVCVWVPNHLHTESYQHKIECRRRLTAHRSIKDWKCAHHIDWGKKQEANAHIHIWKCCSYSFGCEKWLCFAIVDLSAVVDNFLYTVHILCTYARMNEIQFLQHPIFMCVEGFQCYMNKISIRCYSGFNALQQILFWPLCSLIWCHCFSITLDVSAFNNHSLNHWLSLSFSHSLDALLCFSAALTVY